MFENITLNVSTRTVASRLPTIPALGPAAPKPKHFTTQYQKGFPFSSVCKRVPYININRSVLFKSKKAVVLIVAFRVVLHRILTKFCEFGIHFSLTLIF